MKFIILLLVASLPSTLLAQSLSTRTQVNTPEEELAGFTVPEGFVIELVASERDGIVNPIDLTFDDHGRLWTQTAVMYPMDPIADIQWNDLLNLMNDQEAQKTHPNFKRVLDLYQGKTKGTDKILVLSDFYGQGPVKVTTWADGLTIPQSILPYKNGAYVAQGSELFFLDDTNQDGKADERDPMFTGFGFTDSHTMSHTLVRAPGDWIHLSHGGLNKGEVSSLHSDAKVKINYSKIARFSLDAKKIELVSSGLNNIWGFQLRHNGQWYASEANDLSWSVVNLEPGVGFPGIGGDRLRPYQPWMPRLHDFRVGGTGISGLAFADDASGSFPDKWKDVALLANPITSTINAVRMVRNPDGSVTASHLPDFLTSKDDWFRPVNMEFGPDGCLYIADWYNKIVSHNEVPTTDPSRDKTHGRIWRIRHTSQKPREIPDFYTIKTDELVSYLSSPSLWEKRAAWHQISDRPIAETKKLTSSLVSLAADQSQDEITRIHALWSLEGIHHYDAKLLTSLLQSPLHHLRREAVRSLTSFSLTPAQVASAVKGLIEDKNPTVRSQVIRTLTHIQAADQSTIDILMRACKPELPGHAMGGSYERKHERFLARMALEQYPTELQAYINSPAADKVPAENLLWAVQALPKTQSETAFLKFWPKANLKKLDESTFVSIANMLDNQEICQAVKSVILNPAHAAEYVNFALQNQAQVQSAELAELIQEPVNSLLQKGSEEYIDLALDAIGRFDIKSSGKTIVRLINEQSSEKTLGLALRALENDPKTNQAVFADMFRNENFSFEIRSTALNSLAKADPDAGLQALEQWIPEITDSQKRELASMLSGTNEGADLLKDVYDQKLMDITAFNLSAAERIHNTDQSDPRGEAILEGVKKREEEERKAFDDKLHKYIAIAENKEGTPLKGKTLFQTCLMCHKVGNEGQDIAPALDGSANRDTEALLTAILDPNAAVETGYTLYRVTRKDGSSVEGYLVKKDDRGTTLAFMGGSEVFIESENIRSQGALGGRSFMPKGLIESYTDEQIADLISYIRTLE
ncbi:MAG: c-type cytochrome [Cyclobacteriaceae bacterium]